MKGIYAVSLLIVSNIFMTFAWYGHLKLQETKVISNWPLYGVILFSWLIALAEYSCQVPANRLGFNGNGGPFTLMQLKVIQEVITLIVFTVFSTLLFKGESLHWNHLAAFLCLILAVYFVFMKWLITGWLSKDNKTIGQRMHKSVFITKMNVHLCHIKVYTFII